MTYLDATRRPKDYLLRRPARSHASKLQVVSSARIECAVVVTAYFRSHPSANSGTQLRARRREGRGHEVAKRNYPNRELFHRGIHQVERRSPRMKRRQYAHEPTRNDVCRTIELRQNSDASSGDDHRPN